MTRQVRGGVWKSPRKPPVSAHVAFWLVVPV
jgi:hypothetical protein